MDVPPPNGELVTQEIPRCYKLFRGESSVFFEFGFFEDLNVASHRRREGGSNMSRIRIAECDEMSTRRDQTSRRGEEARVWEAKAYWGEVVPYSPILALFHSIRR
jgi:hypothetical protein